MKRKIFLWILAFSCLAIAQENKPVVEEENKPIELEPMVVTGTPTPRNISGVTATVSVIPREEIEGSDAVYVGDLLKYHPAVHISDEGTFGRQGISIRGLGSNCRRIQLLFDGRPEKMSLFGCIVTQTVPLTNIDRIELARGPESVLYGSDSLGGTINVITRRRTEPGFETSIIGSYGSNGTWHSQLSHGGKSGAFDYYITADHKQTEGHRPNSEYKSDFGSIRLGYQIDPVWRAEFRSQFFEDDAENPGPTWRPAQNADEMMYRRWSWDASLSAKVDLTDFVISCYQNYGKHDFNMPTFNDYWLSKDYTFGVLTKLTQVVYESDAVSDAITIGYEYQRQWAKPLDDYTDRIVAMRQFYDFGPYTTNMHEAFAYNELTIGPVVATAGLRAHWDDWKEHLEWIPQAGLLWHATESTTFKAKVSKGFRLPRFSELYLFPAHNERLEPEKLWNFEAGVSQTLFDKRLQLSATGFYSRMRNQVRTLNNPNPPPMRLNVNTESFFIRGIELEARANPWDPLTLAIAYSLIDVEDPRGTGHINREDTPQHMVAAMAQLKVNKLTFTCEAKFVEGLYASNQTDGGIGLLNDYFVSNLGLSYQVAKNLRVFGGVDNLFNTTYEEYRGYPAPGRTFHVGMHVTF